MVPGALLHSNCLQSRPVFALAAHLPAPARYGSDGPPQPWPLIRDALSATPLVKIGGRRLARTQRGHLALVVAGAREGDSVGIFQGGKTPLIIRATGTGTWQILGDAYVHGIMKGEVWDELKCEEIQFD